MIRLVRPAWGGMRGKTKKVVMEVLRAYNVLILVVVCLFIQYRNVFVVIMNQKRSVTAVCLVESMTSQY